MHPINNIHNQAKSLADTLEITAKEAEAYLHWYITGNDTTHADIANWMDISPSMATRHLQTAKDHIETTDDTNKANAFHQFLIRTDIGTTADKTHKIIEAEFETTAFAVITKEAVKTNTEAYQLHIGQTDTNWNNKFIDNIPDSMTLPNEWNLITISGSTLTELIEHTEYYLQNTSKQLTDNTHLTIFHTFKNTPVTSEYLAENAIEALQTPG